MVGVVCCICHEDLFRRGKSGTGANDGVDREKGKSQQEKPIVTTKCGHLFHSNCLKCWFQKKGAEVWTKRECPVCQMSLTVATDLIRLFPNLEDDTGMTIEDLKTHIGKLENANKTLTESLEAAFIRHRDIERKFNQKMKENEHLQKAYILETTKGAQFQNEALNLKKENEELRNVIIALNKALASGNGINLSNSAMQSFCNDGHGGGGPPQTFQSQFRGKQGYSQYGENTSHILGSSSGRIHQNDRIGTNGWVPSKPVNNIPNMVNSNKSELHEGFASMSLKATQGNADSYVTGDDKIVSHDGAILKSYVVGGMSPAQESLQSDSHDNIRRSQSDGETGDMKIDGSQSINSMTNYKNGKLGTSFIVQATQELRKLLPAHADFPDPNGNRNNIVTDETPTDELMDAILNAKPKSAGGPNDAKLLEVNKGSTPDLRKGGLRGKTDENYSDKKIYGKFFCDNCKAKWGTARHVYNKPQTCLRCSETVFPYAQEPVMTKDELAHEKLNRKRKT